MKNMDIVCLSHLRLDFVFQRPQHLLTRCARDRRVFFVEEPIADSASGDRLEISPRESGIEVVVPRIRPGLPPAEQSRTLKHLFDGLLEERRIDPCVLWYYTPMALEFTRHLNPAGVVYDCMDELSAFHGAPKEMSDREDELLRRADVVFTGGQSLYEARRHRHPNVHAFPSSIDAAHFGRARSALSDPDDQAAIPRPRLGYCGVIDERMDLSLLAALAEERPAWQLVLVGPVVKIDPATLPRRPNIHYLGGRDYRSLPEYLAGWDVALLPFADNASTRFISPTKTPEYLAAGKPVVSTAIRDVVRPYGEKGLVRIASTGPDFIAAVEQTLAERDRTTWLESVDRFLAGTSWDTTWERMKALLPLGPAERSLK